MCPGGRALSEAEILAAKPNLDPRHWRQSGTARSFKRVYRPSLAYRMALVAQGRFDGMMTLRPSWEWDIAAGDLILREAGGPVHQPDLSQPLRFNNPHPRLNGVIAAGPALHAGLCARLDPNGKPGISA